MIDKNHEPVSRQAKELGISRGSVYLPRATSVADLALMRRIDELHLDYPFAGSRMLQWLLRAEGHKAGRLHVATLMKRMGMEALYRRPNTSKPEPGHKIYPYLLRKLPVTQGNHVWAMDITYIPMARGFVYLAAVVDWFSRKVLSWRLSITMDVDFCLEAVEEAMARHGKPEIFNTDSKNIGACSASEPWTSQPSTSNDRWTHHKKCKGSVRTPVSDVSGLYKGWSIKRRGSASPMLVTQEGPDILSPYCLVQGSGLGGTSHFGR